jgi:hypothetical protein
VSSTFCGDCVGFEAVAIFGFSFCLGRASEGLGSSLAVAFFVGLAEATVGAALRAALDAAFATSVSGLCDCAGPDVGLVGVGCDAAVPTG